MTRSFEPLINTNGPLIRISETLVWISGYPRGFTAGSLPATRREGSLCPGPGRPDSADDGYGLLIPSARAGRSDPEHRHRDPGGLGAKAGRIRPG